MDNGMFEYKRKSYLELGEIYFWTATIHNWNKLMAEDRYKDIVISSLNHLSQLGKIDVFAFVIMPNHMHLIWRINEMNGNEKAQASVLKFTAHAFKNMLRESQPDLLHLFKVEAKNKDYEFWKRDSLGIQLYTPEVALQKLDYIHNNPLAKHWALAQEPSQYYYSSAAFYELGKSDFEFLKDLREEF